ncbi:hypothetical protein GCM10011385_40100 [Nitratireductor aestuarii]|uniref:Uncharacterized protein n=1 Tax=Nitratireductor aestuarii TaxID=1735103 RepID=A0A916WB02_9HYPH|nr:hypothetical protein [Nitratireductor aestuarii]GGA81842.1 hypothetical protein GCM10011385_40100 [Nitratireductor aestuarii]
MTDFAPASSDTLHRWLALYLDEAVKAEIRRELERRETPMRKAA